MERYLKTPIGEDLGEKMVFVGGPRQVGKTMLSLSLLAGGNESHPAYLNWDDPSSRRMLLAGALPGASSIPTWVMGRDASPRRPTSGLGHPRELRFIPTQIKACIFSSVNESMHRRSLHGKIFKNSYL